MTIIYPRPWPIGMGIQKSRFGLSPNQALFASVFSRKVSVQSHAAGKTDRWEGILTTTPLRGAEHATMRAWFLSLDGQAKTVFLYDPDLREPRSGAKSGGGFANYLLSSGGLDLWTASRLTITGPTSNATLGFDHFSLLPTAVSGTHQIFQTKQPAKAGQQYALTVHAKDSGYDQLRLFAEEFDADGNLIAVRHDALINTTTGVATALGSSTTVSATALGDGWHRLTAVAALGSDAAFLRVAVRVKDLGGSGSFTGDGTSDILLAGPQLEEGAAFSAYEATTTGPLVNGGVQSGTALVTDGWKASSAVLLAGDYFQVGTQYFMVIEDASSDSGGAATLEFRPAMRASPADNAEIILLNPALVARLQLADMFWEIDQTGMGSFSFSFEEAL